MAKKNRKASEPFPPDLKFKLGPIEPLGETVEVVPPPAMESLRDLSGWLGDLADWVAAVSFLIPEEGQELPRRILEDIELGLIMVYRALDTGRLQQMQELHVQDPNDGFPMSKLMDGTHTIREKRDHEAGWGPVEVLLQVVNRRISAVEGAA